MPLLVNTKLQEDLSYIYRLPNVHSLKKMDEVFMPSIDNRKKDSTTDLDLSNKIKHAQMLQELLLVLAICNTVVVSKHPHYDLVSISFLDVTWKVNRLSSPPKRRVFYSVFPQFDIIRHVRLLRLNSMEGFWKV